MIDAQQLRNHIIAPTLDMLGYMSPNAEELLFAICCHESQRGTYVKQVGGQALGIYQMEPSTYYDIMDNYLSRNDELYARVYRMLDITREPLADDMKTNMKLATIMARIFFLRIPEKLPPKDDIYAIAIYWKKYYNTPYGKGTIDKFVNDYNDLKS